MPNKERTKRTYSPRRTVAQQVAAIEAQTAGLKARAATQEKHARH